MRESGPQDGTDVPNKGGAGRNECPTGGQGQVDEHVPRLPGRRPQAPRLPGLRASKGCKKQFPLCAAGEEKPQPGTVGGAGTLGGVSALGELQLGVRKAQAWSPHFPHFGSCQVSPASPRGLEPHLHGQQQHLVAT